ncbi:hypothetical protein [Phytopseudomonas flavescens]|nr:hypothetical protein [Pseudomonas flavescens]
MPRFWTPHASARQRLVATAILLWLLGAAFYLLFIHDFVPDEALFWPSLGIALGLSGGVTLWVLQGISRKTWVVGDDLSGYGIKKKTLLLLACLLLLGFASWINTGYLIPRYLTRVIGSSAERSDLVTTRKHYGKHRTCDYSLDGRWSRGLLVSVCVDAAFHQAAPRQAFSVRLRTRESALGFIVEAVSRAPAMLNR